MITFSFIKKEKKIQESRDFFEQLVNDYPTNGKIWKTYIEQEVTFNILMIKYLSNYGISTILSNKS